VFREQEKDLQSYELNVYKMMERMDQLQKLQVDQQKQYAESLTDLTETIKIQS